MPDRLGLQRRTWKGMEVDFNNAQEGRQASFDQFLAASAFIWIGDYGPGLTFTSRSQYTVRDGMAYRLSAETTIPYTSTGNWALEQDNFSLVNTEAVLRQDLGNGTPYLVDSSVVGLKRFPTSQSTNVERVLQRNIQANVLDYMTEAEVADVLSGSPTMDHTTAFQMALTNNVTVVAPPLAFNVGNVNMDRFGHALIGLDGSGGQAYGGGAVINGINSTGPIISVSKPTSFFSGLVFKGLSSSSEKGEDTDQTGISFVGSSQKDIDAKVQNCGFLYLRAATQANGTNIEYDSTIFSNCKHALKIVNTGGWENRGFIFSPTCRFHSMGKTGTDSAVIDMPPSYNVRDVSVAGVCDDSVTMFSGFASGLDIDVQMVRARGTGLNINAAGHGNPAQVRVVSIKHFSYYATDAINTTMDNSGIIASGLMRLTYGYVDINGCGGHGIQQGVVGAILGNVHVSDAGQFADNTYDGVLVTGSGSFLKVVSTSQGAQGYTPANKARWGINIQASVYVGALSPGLNTASGPLNVLATSTIYGDLPYATGPAPRVSWGNAIPVTGTYIQGSIIWNKTPISGAAIGWTCVVSGSPGTWKSFGLVSA
ncbi:MULTISPECIES: hypothetical protein [unclassified Pseudomonas]|uniref:hypothetical protein n=1 Tax=unclassified Pseudomonas TaxID=196821 RepID=UPI0014640F2D|nr:MULTISPECIES: hypothetical protein [unclassified Pseudomonas]QJI20323.1 hypothetical protein HKK57_19235 [Pseudomonas sp. ADAK21]QJI24523.1 hypothetical protein HKK56_13855 [Pseudomonas sp. ADAK20]